MEDDNKYSEENTLPIQSDELIDDEFTNKLSSSVKQSNEDCQLLSIDDINISLKVVGDLKSGSKLKILNYKHLAEDNSYINSMTRYQTNQGRDRIIVFLENLFSEVTRNVYVILSEIRNKVNIDNNIHILQGLIYKVSVFLHNYETMRVVYKSDSGAYSRLGINRDKFFMFLNTLFRDLTTYGTK